MILVNNPFKDTGREGEMERVCAVDSRRILERNVLFASLIKVLTLLLLYRLVALMSLLL